jgi:starch phosphorylase
MPESEARPEPRIAYFSMEIAVDPPLPTYAGGLGILAGDTLRSAADLGVPIVAVTLLHRKGYFRQRLDAVGNQTEEPVDWRPELLLDPVDGVVGVEIGGRSVTVRAWRFTIQGHSGHEVPVYMLDTALERNSPADRALTDFLYGGDDRYRLAQEAVLGVGGVRMLARCGYRRIESYHMNEGHSALLVLELLRERLGGRPPEDATDADLDVVRRKCIFTTHTPVPAGHDQFSSDVVGEVLGDFAVRLFDATNCCGNGTLNMTYLALRASHYINGVAMHHGEISRGMFPRYPIRAITNGVHALTWTAPAFRDLYDRHIPEWQHDNLYLRYAAGISLEEIRAAHAEARRTLVEEIRLRAGATLDETVLTVGFARRATPYKRPDLLFQNLERLRWIARNVGPLQLVWGGKAHPHDHGGKDLVRRVIGAGKALEGSVRLVYIEDYDFRWGQLLTSGCDLWLNTPQKPQEASGTSGMKAALNGVPSLSVLDGWWLEGHVEGVTGWAIACGDDVVESADAEAASLYDKLERAIVPLYYGRPDDYARVMRSAIALNGSFFNTQRMVAQYVTNAYSPACVSDLCDSPVRPSLRG